MTVSARAGPGERTELLQILLAGAAPVGLAMSATALALFAELPAPGRYVWDLFPGFLIGGIGMALGFVPITIGALAGVRPGDAGVASGLVNTAQQVGGAAVLIESAPASAPAQLEAGHEELAVEQAA